MIVRSVVLFVSRITQERVNGRSFEGHFSYCKRFRCLHLKIKHVRSQTQRPDIIGEQLFLLLYSTGTCCMMLSATS